VTGKSPSLRPPPPLSPQRSPSRAARLASPCRDRPRTAGRRPCGSCRSGSRPGSIAPGSTTPLPPPPPRCRAPRPPPTLPGPASRNRSGSPVRSPLHLDLAGGQVDPADHVPRHRQEALAALVLDAHHVVRAGAEELLDPPEDLALRVHDLEADHVRLVELVLGG